MKHKLFLIAIVLLSTANIVAQQAKLYNPAADATKDIANAVTKAAALNKFVLIQAGGNWCSLCLEFTRFSKADK